MLGYPTGKESASLAHGLIAHTHYRDEYLPMLLSASMHIVNISPRSSVGSRRTGARRAL